MLGDDIKKLGFGLMRLPEKDGKIDIDQTEEMADLFLENGFTYFDTAYVYFNGESEKAAKRALCDRHERSSFILTSKLPSWVAKNRGEAEKTFYTSLDRTGAGYFDFYLLHSLTNENIHLYDEYDLWNFVQKRKSEGLIKHVGFSFHDNAARLDELLTKHSEVEFVQLQLNYADWESENIQSRKCYEVARKHGKPIIVMEPVKGGSLANLSDVVAKPFRDYDKNASLPSWAIRFSASLDGVITVLSGMSNLAQMNDNISYMRDFKKLNAQELAAVETVRKNLDKVPKIPCTGCKYCMKGCPKGINIPNCFTAMNLYLQYNTLQWAKNKYSWEASAGHNASDCINCKACERVCPQHIKVPDELKKVAAILEK